MTESLRALLSGIIDYAGLFPPASLTLESATRNFSTYLRDPDAWMLARFICPASKLSELLKLNLNLSDWRISALGRSGKDCGEFVDGMKRDIAEIDTFRAKSGAVVDAFETRLPPDACNLSVKSLPVPNASDCFFECTPGSDWKSAIAFAVESLTESGHGFKLRTGGVEASAFPPVKQIAFALTRTRDAKVPIKFTAGLHHPIRHFNESVDTTMHGFVNVFAAAVMSHLHQLDETAVAEILSDESAPSFQFSPDGMKWNRLEATTAQIANVRAAGAISFGSCSFDEPRDDLRTLGLL